MSKWLQFVLAGCAIVVTGAVCALCVQTMRQEQAIGDAATALRQSMPDLRGVEKTVEKASSTLDAINAPCVGFHGSVTCGPIAQLSQTAKNVGIVAGLSAQQVKQSGVLIDSAAKSVTEVSAHVNRTADALTQTAQGATDTLAEGKRTIAAIQPVLGAFKQDVDDINALLRDEAIHRTLANLDATTQNLGGITLDARLVSDKISADYLRPKTPWSRIGHVGLDLLDIGAMTARHVP